MRAFHEQIIAGSRLLEDIFAPLGIHVHQALAAREDLVVSPTDLLEDPDQVAAYGAEGGIDQDVRVISYITLCSLLPQRSVRCLRLDTYI